ARTLTPPEHERRPVEITQHGETRVDNYGWMRVDNWQDVLRDPSALSSDVKAALDAENAYYEGATAHLATLRETLKAEMRARIKEDEASVPLPDGPWKYWREFREGGDYPVFYRAPREGGDRQAIYDGDAERGDADFFSIGAVAHSPDHTLAAITMDRLGSEYYSIRFRNIETGAELADEITSADGDSIAWTADSSALYYIERDDNQRPKRVKRHVLGEAPSEDVVVYEEPEDGYFLGVSKSQSGDFIFITSSNATTSEVRFLPANDPAATATLIAPRESGVEYYAEHRGDAFYLYTNVDGAVDFKI
ncbi:MAG: S9 family peptidase, partial [Pseudomonadota bacterium]